MKPPADFILETLVGLRRPKVTLHLIRMSHLCPMHPAPEVWRAPPQPCGAISKNAKYVNVEKTVCFPTLLRVQPLLSFHLKHALIAESVCFLSKNKQHFRRRKFCAGLKSCDLLWLRSGAETNNWMAAAGSESSQQRSCRSVLLHCRGEKLFC